MGKDNRDVNTRKASQLNMPLGTANNKLRLKVIYSLLCQQNLNKCFRCDGQIEYVEDLSIIHKEPWFNIDSNLFWDMKNIAFSHRNNCGAAKQDSNMYSTTNENTIKATIVDENGNQLKTWVHEGQTFVAGEVGSRYQLKVTNNCWDDIEVVMSVDGRDILSGEVGNPATQTGYIIRKNSSDTFDGFRQTDDNVAAFRFSAQEESYQSKMSGGEVANLGVIGFAVFKSKEKFRSMKLSSTRSRRKGSDMFLGSTLDSMSTSRGTTMDSMLGERIPPSQIGTEYGETIESKVTKVSFTRENQTVPNEIVSITYDTIDGLRAKGVPVDPPKAETKPNPFPDMVQAGYAPVPPK